MSDNWAKSRYLDASALVKLVIDEGDHQLVRSFFFSNTNFCTTSLCLAEALGVIKGKWNHKHINEKEYFKATSEFINWAWSKTIEIDEVNLFSSEGLTAVEKLAKKHTLDLSDALQLQTIMHGKYSHLGPNSASVLITADKKLSKAADDEDIRFWNCVVSEPPSWA